MTNESKTLEIAIRNSENKRFTAFYKVNLSQTVQEELSDSLNKILYTQTEQLAGLFNLLDKRFSYCLLSVISSNCIAIDEFFEMDKISQQRFNPQLHRNFTTVYNAVVELASSLLFTVKEFPDIYFDQRFVKETILALQEINFRYISLDCNNLMNSQKEYISGLLKELIETYNKRLENIIRCYKFQAFSYATNCFFEALNSGGNGFWAMNFCNLLTQSIDQLGFIENVKRNKIEIEYEPLLIEETDTVA